MTQAISADRVREVLQPPLQLSVWSDPRISRHHGSALAIGQTGQRLTFALENRSDEALTLRPLGGERAEAAYHFRLSFRPGTLVDPGAVSIEGMDGALWEIEPVHNRTGRQVFHIRRLEEDTLRPASGNQVAFVLGNLGPLGEHGAAQSEFSLNFDHLHRADRSRLSGHLLGRLSVFEPIDDHLTTLQARTGPHAYGPLVGVKATWPDLKTFAEGGRMVTLEFCNTSGETLPMRAGERPATIRLPDFGPKDFRSEVFALNAASPRFRILGAGGRDWVLGPDHRSLVPSHDFDWAPQTRYQMEVYLEEPDLLASLPRQLLLEYENFGLSGARAGDLVVAFDANGLTPEPLADGKGVRVRVASLDRRDSPLSVIYPDKRPPHVESSFLQVRTLVVQDPDTPSRKGVIETFDEGVRLQVDAGEIWKLRSADLEIGMPSKRAGRIRPEADALCIEADASLTIRSAQAISVTATGPVSLTGGGRSDEATRAAAALLVDGDAVWMKRALVKEVCATHLLQAPPAGVTLLQERDSDGTEWVVRLRLKTDRTKNPLYGTAYHATLQLHGILSKGGRVIQSLDLTLDPKTLQRKPAVDGLSLNVFKAV